MYTRPMAKHSLASFEPSREGALPGGRHSPLPMQHCHREAWWPCLGRTLERGCLDPGFKASSFRCTEGPVMNQRRYFGTNFVYCMRYAPTRRQEGAVTADMESSAIEHRSAQTLHASSTARLGKCR